MIDLLLSLALQTAPDAGPDAIGQLIAAQEEAQTYPEDAVPADSVPVAHVGPVEPQAGCAGARTEGALLICRYAPGSELRLGEVSTIADAQGYALLGIPRRAADRLNFTVEAPAGATGASRVSETWDIASRDYVLQQVDGVPQATVTPDPSTLPRRQREYAQKQEAFNSVWDGQGFLDGFEPPADGITTGVYGSARVYNNGHEGSPHWGLDWANAVGTPIHAPAGGLVTLAEPDMYYEGGLIFIDHGHGLVSAFLHLSGVTVEAGDIVEQGQLIGAMGAGGRATGSHLDWRVKLRNGFYVDPDLLLTLDVSDLLDTR